MNCPISKFRVAFVEAVMDYLYGGLLSHQQGALKRIIIDNTNAQRSSVFAFRYLGETFQLYPKERLPRQLNRLLPELKPRMREWIEERDNVLMEQPYIVMYLRKVAVQARTFADYRALLPSALHGLLDTLKETCPDNGPSALSPESIAAFQEEHRQTINAIKQRLALNIILQ